MMDGGVGRGTEEGAVLDGWRSRTRERGAGGAKLMEEWDEGEKRRQG